METHLFWFPVPRSNRNDNFIDKSFTVMAMKHDKKMRDGRMYFILVNAIGDAFVSGDVPPDAVEALLQRGANAV